MFTTSFVHPELKRWRESRVYRENVDHFMPEYEILQNVQNSNNNNNNSKRSPLLQHQPAPALRSHHEQNNNNSNNGGENDDAAENKNNNNFNIEAVESALIETQRELFANPTTASNTLRERESYLRSQLDSHRKKHSELQDNVQKMRARLQAMEKDLKNNELKLQRRDDSVYAAFLNLEQMHHQEHQREQDTKKEETITDANISWAPSTSVAIDFLSNFSKSIRGNRSESSNLKDSSSFRSSSITAKSKTFSNEGSFLFFRNIGAALPAAISSRQFQVESLLSPALTIAENGVDVVFRKPKANIRSRPQPENDGTNTSAEEGASHQDQSSLQQQSTSLFCELELCTRHHLAKIMSSSSIPEQQKKDIAFSIFCKDFSCTLHHHYEIPRRFSVGLDLLTMLADQARITSSYQEEQQQQHSFSSTDEILNYICEKSHQAETLILKQVELTTHLHHLLHQNNNSNNTDVGAAAAGNTEMNNDEMVPAVVELVTEWSLQIARDILHSGWHLRSFALSSSSSAASEKEEKTNNVSSSFRSIVREISIEAKSKSEMQSRIQDSISKVAQEMSSVNDKNLAAQQERYDSLFSSSSSSSSSTALTKTIKGQIKEGKFEEAFSSSCDLVQLSCQTHQKVEQLQQCLIDALKVGNRAVVHSTATSCLTSSSSASTSIYNRTVRLLALVAVFDDGSMVDFISKEILSSSTLLPTLPLDVVSHWNVVVFVCALRLLSSFVNTEGTQRQNQNSPTFITLFEKFSSLNGARDDKNEKNASSHAPLTLENLIDLDSRQIHSTNTNHNNNSDSFTCLRFCQKLLDDFYSIYFFSAKLQTTIASDSMKSVNEAFNITSFQIKEVLFDRQLSSSTSSRETFQDQKQYNELQIILRRLTLDKSSPAAHQEGLKAITRYYFEKKPSDLLSHYYIFRRIVETTSSSSGAAEWFLDNWITLQQRRTTALIYNKNQNTNNNKTTTTVLSSPGKGGSSPPPSSSNRLPSPPPPSVAHYSHKDYQNQQFWWNASAPDDQNYKNIDADDDGANSNKKRLLDPSFYAGELLVGFHQLYLMKKASVKAANTDSNKMNRNAIENTVCERLKMRLLRAVKHDADFQEMLTANNSSQIATTSTILALIKDACRLCSILSMNQLFNRSGGGVKKDRHAGTFQEKLSFATFYPCEYLTLVEKFSTSLYELESRNIIDNSSDEAVVLCEWLGNLANCGEVDNVLSANNKVIEFLGRIQQFVKAKNV